MTMLDDILEAAANRKHVRIDRVGYEQIVREFARHYDNPSAWSFEARSTLALGMRNLLAGGTSPGEPTIEIDAESWQETADEMADKRRASDAANVHWWQWNVENCKVIE